MRGLASPVHYHRRPHTSSAIQIYGQLYARMPEQSVDTLLLLAQPLYGLCRLTTLSLWLGYDSMVLSYELYLCSWRPFLGLLISGSAPKSHPTNTSRNGPRVLIRTTLAMCPFCASSDLAALYIPHLYSTLKYYFYNAGSEHSPGRQLWNLVVCLAVVVAPRGQARVRVASPSYSPTHRCPRLWR